MFSDTLRNWIVAAIESRGDSSSLELDSHADSPVVGSEALIISTHDIKVRVYGFTPALRSKTVDVVESPNRNEAQPAITIYHEASWTKSK